MITVKLSRSFLVALTVSALVGSGSALAAGSPAGGHGQGHDIGQPAPATEADRTIEILMGDNYYEPERLSIRAGETVRFVVKNAGEFLHEFSIGTAAMHAGHQKEMQTMMEHGMLTPTGIDHDKMKMDHGSGHMTHDDPNSVLVEPGQTAELVWRFSTATDLEFACNLPGHYESGMMGEIDSIRPAGADS